MKKVLKEVLRDIKPTKLEEQKLLLTTKKILQSITLKHTHALVGGSGAKGTWLRGNHDIDIYIAFSKEHYAGEDISKILGKHLEKKFKLVKLHGSRDYYQTDYEGYKIEFIPLFHITHPTDAANITDISPLHTIYVRKFKKPDEIRLFKAFCKAQGVYGAESYTQGLSGYVCEILVIHYGTFANTIKHIVQWKSSTEIGNKQRIQALNEAKKQSPLILIDPVDPYRNAAAAMGQESYDLLRNACKKFLKKPNKTFFIKHVLTFEDLRKKYPKNKILAYEVTPLESKKDVAGAKPRKGIEYLSQELKRTGFILIKSVWTWEDKALYYFVLDPKPLPYLRKHYGPPSDNTKAVDAFRKKWKGIPLKKQGKKIFVELPREHQIPEDYLTHIIRSDENLKHYFQKMRKLY